MEHDQKTAKAFGGCTKCYGKGYSTQEVAAGTMYHPCAACDRGIQVTKLIADVAQRADTHLLAYMSETLDHFIEAKYTKGFQAKNVRDHITAFLDWTRENI